MTARPPSPPRPALLLVEDDDDHAELFARALEPSDVQLHRARDRDDARRLLEQLSSGDVAQLAAIVVDLRLPRHSGIELLAELSENPRVSLIPRVVFTSSASPEDVRAAYAANAQSYLVKPVEPAAFQTVVREAASYWTNRNLRVEL